MEAAAAAFQAALQCLPNDAASLVNLAHLRHEADDYPAAHAHYQAALVVDNDAATQLSAALLMPIFCADADEIAAHRARIIAQLEALQQRPMTIMEPPRNIAAAAGYFACHGKNDRELMSHLGDVVSRAWRPTPLPRVTRAARPRIAFVSAHFKQHAIARLYLPLLERLPRHDFDVAVLSIGQHDGLLAGRVMAAADHGLAVPDNLQAARHGLHALAADVVVYCDIGLDPCSYYLAAERQAPVQCLGWGHPITSGLASIDYFISSQLLEARDAQQHYRERLIELPSWPALYEAPATVRAPPSRQDLSFGANEHIYLCPHSLVMLHPDFDAYLAAILRGDRHGVVILLDQRAAWRSHLEARFARTLPDVAARIRFIPAVGAQHFAALLAAADVVLDPLHCSDGYISFETIWAQTRFVTQRGDYLRGRVTAGLCDLLGLDECVATDAADYAARALAMAGERRVRDQLTAKLATRKHQLLSLDDSVLPAYTAFFKRALDEAARARRWASAPLVQEAEK